MNPIVQVLSGSAGTLFAVFIYTKLESLPLSWSSWLLSVAILQGVCFAFIGIVRQFEKTS